MITRWVAVFMVLGQAAAAEFVLSDMVGSWGGKGMYIEHPTQANMRCRLKVAGDDTQVHVKGRCASSLGAQDVNILLRDAGGARLTIVPGPGAAPGSSGIESFTGSKSGDLVILSGKSDTQSAKIQFEKLANGKMVFLSERQWDGKLAQSEVTLSRK